MADIQIADELMAGHPEVKLLDKAGLLQAAQRTLQVRKDAGETHLTVVITDEKTLHQLNKTYLGEDRPTDVLAFASGEYDPEEALLYLGDVVISYPRAAAQARAAGHETFDEIRLLVIHGVLHLLGYDHGDPEAKAAMWAVQDDVLSDLGIAVTVRE